MRYIRSFPLVSSLNSIKYLRNLFNNSVQKLDSIDIKVIINSDDSNVKSEENTKTEDLVLKSSVETINNKELIGSQNNNNNNIENNSIKQFNENAFESAVNEWIESPNNSNERNTILSKDNKKSSVSTPLVSRCALEMRTKQLIHGLSRSQSSMSTTLLLQELSKHLVSYPESMTIALNQNAIQKVLRLREWSNSKVVQSHSMQVLSLLGYCDSPKGTGIRILSIDGGGTRGILVIEILRHLEKMIGKPIHTMFDLICGVSTGAIIATLLALQTPIDECELYYHRFSSHLFKSDLIRGAGRLLWSHAYYDTSVWESILKDIYRETDLIETIQNKDCPRFLAISAVMNTPSIQAYLFRNYELPVSTRSLSQYEGSAKYKIWEAVRASAAAPGFFEELTLDNYVHQDGGILINNPTAIAIHEAKMLWPNEHIQCVLSLGSGRYIPPKTIKPDLSPASPTSLKTKLIGLINSATDTEMVHRLMQDLLPAKTYYRLNPSLTEIGTIDENRPQKLQQMKVDAQMYLRKNDYKVNEALKCLTTQRKLLQKVDDWMRLNYKLRI